MEPEGSVLCVVCVHESDLRSGERDNELNFQRLNRFEKIKMRMKLYSKSFFYVFIAFGVNEPFFPRIPCRRKSFFFLSWLFSC